MIFSDKNPHIQLVGWLAGEVYDAWRTDPKLLAMHCINDTPTGLLVSRDIARMIDGCKAVGLLDWLDELVNRIHGVHPQIERDYIRLALYPLRMGYRNGKREKVLIV